MHGSRVLISPTNEHSESRQKFAVRPTIPFRIEASHSSTSNVTVAPGRKLAAEVRKMFAHVARVPSWSIDSRLIACFSRKCLVLYRSGCLIPVRSARLCTRPVDECEANVSCTAITSTQRVYSGSRVTRSRRHCPEAQIRSVPVGTRKLAQDSQSQLLAVGRARGAIRARARRRS